jgi:hypothetical protein
LVVISSVCLVGLRLAGGGELGGADHFLGGGPVVGKNEDVAEAGYPEDAPGQSGNAAENKLTSRILQ